MLTSKETHIIQILSMKKEPVSSKELAQNLGCSVRSIKSYIKYINEEYSDAIVSSRKGYHLNRNISRNVFMENKAPQSVDERKSFLFKNLLLKGEKYDIEDLAGLLCISSETLIREIRLFNQELAKDHLKIVYNEENVRIEGSEKNKRSAISRFISEDVKSAVFSYETLKEYFPSYQIDTFYEEMVEILKNNGFYLDDFSIFNFLLHIVIAADRSKLATNYEIRTEDSFSRLIIPKHITKLINEIDRRFSSITNIHLSQEDCRELALLLYTRLTNENETKDTLDSVFENSSPDIVRLIRIIEDYLKSVYNIEISDYQAKLRFLIHIKNLCIRIKERISISNPMIYEARKHLYIFDVAISIGKIIESYYQCILSEDEIAYIAIHLIFSISQNTDDDNKLSVLLMCPNYSNIQQFLRTKIKSFFLNNIGTLDVIGFYRQISSSRYDLVITAFETKSMLPENYVKISTTLNSKDIGRISDKIEDITAERTKKKFIHGLESFLKPEFFFVDQSDSLDMKTLLTLMSDRLWKDGCVSSEYKEYLIIREQQYPTTYGEVAIPHPINYDAIQSAIAVGVNKNGIAWCNGKIIKVVFILAFRKDDQIHFSEILDYLSGILLDDAHIKRLSKTETYEDFLEQLCKENTY